MINYNQRCQAMLRNTGWKPNQCSNKSNMRHEGKRYCGTHDPIKRKKRQVQRDKTDQERLSAKYKSFNLMQDRARLFPAIVAALEGLYNAADSVAHLTPETLKTAEAVLSKVKELDDE